MWDFIKRYLKIKITKELDEYEEKQQRKKERTPAPTPIQARETLVIKKPPVIPTPEPTTVRPTNTSNLPNLRFGDGAGGLLWKHHSESDGKVVILLPSAFPKADKLFITNGQDTVHATWAGWHNPEHTIEGKKDRGHYRLPLSAEQINKRLGKSVTIVANFAGVVRKVQVENVRKRHD